MSRISNREKLLKKGLQLVHERGFGGSSVRDIVQAAGVPQGSFTNHFVSKEAFGLEVLERYHALTKAGVAATLRNDDLAPMKRFRLWLDTQLAYLEPRDMRRGCLYGNLGAEQSETSEPIRRRVAAMLEENTASVAYCFRAAMKADELASAADADDLAAFTIASLQGAVLVSKAQRSPEPMARFMRLLFGTVLPLTPKVKS